MTCNPKNARTGTIKRMGQKIAELYRERGGEPVTDNDLIEAGFRPADCQLIGALARSHARTLLSQSAA
jgi:hypothetical protein